jgi:UDP-N-acetylmuramoyl-L-alanyl-D-glutamate--2,6-diaminopimelate ligase
MEVSSHSVDQKRIAGLKFAGGVCTNLTRDHLDYHKTFENYRDAKKGFFDMLPKGSFAITNADDRNGLIMTQNTKATVKTYSIRGGADFRAKVLEESFEGMNLDINSTEVFVQFVGKFNVQNILAIYASLRMMGFDTQDALIQLSAMRPVNGRFETFRSEKGVTAVIDYAHTPDALENVLKTLREIAPERQLICLFGCGGDRDRTKRPEMGKIAQKMADRIFVTSDNSRSEKTADIMADIKEGMDTAGRAKSLFIEDREQAIRAAIMMAQEGATILLAGKGHETYQINENGKVHFDEREIVLDAFQQNQ